MTLHSENEDVKDAVVSSTVVPPPANSVEIANPTLNPAECICDWCRDNRADMFCDTKPMCWDCLEKLLERENAIEEVKRERGMLASRHFQNSLPPLWEK
jgi:hypothetical protein